MSNDSLYEHREEPIKLRELIKEEWKKSRKKPWTRGSRIKLILLVILLFSIFYLTAPWLHSFWFGLFFMNTGFWVYCIITSLIVWRIARRNKTSLWLIKRQYRDYTELELRNYGRPLAWAGGL